MERKGYKWQLLKGSTKEVCPACGKKRFVPYVLAADNTTRAGELFGRCDREVECGYHRYPDGVRVADCVKREPTPTKPMLQYTGSLYVTHGDTLFGWASSIVGEEAARAAWDRYKVGCTHDGRTIWWQVDTDGVCRGGKIMRYGSDGHRVKAENEWAVLWAHADRWFKPMHTGEELHQCLFGAHLLNEEREKVVMVVESEKTAVLMSVFQPDRLWVATGGVGGIKSIERMAVLNGRRVCLVPDDGCYFDWLRFAKRYGWAIDDVAEREGVFKGCDILDIRIAERASV